MTTMVEIREKFPQYESIPDADLLQGLHAKHYSQIPFEEFASKIDMGQPIQQEPVKQEPTFYDKVMARVKSFQDSGANAINAGADNIVGNLEAGVSLASGVAALAPAGISEVINPGSYDKTLQAYTYQPRSDKGQEMLERTGKAIGEPMGVFIDKYGRHGDAVYDATGSETAGVVVEMLPEVGGAVLGGLGLKQPRFQPPKTPTPKVAETGRLEPVLGKAGEIKRKLINEIPDADTAGLKIAETGRKVGEVVRHPLEAKAISQGWADNVVVMFKNASEATKSAARKMVLAGHGISKNRMTGTSVVDPAGSAFMGPVRRVMDVLKRSGKQIDRVATKNLANKRVDTNGLFGAFEQQIAKLGGTLTKEGKVEFKPGSKLFDQAPSAALLNSTLKQISHYGRNPTALDLHNFKQWIYGKAKYEGKQEGGVNALAEQAVKGLAAEINETLKGISKPYDKVNSAYSEARGALTNLQELTGKRVDLTSDIIDTTIGTKLKNILKENVNSGPFKDSVAEIVRVAEKNGPKFDTDLKVLMELAAETERMFGAAPANSFTGSIARAAEGGTRGIVGRTLDTAGGHVLNKALGKNQDNALKSMLILLKSGK